MSNPESGGRIEAFRYAPPAELKDVVEALWHGRWDLRDQAPHVTELLADPCMNLVIEDGGPHPGARAVGVWPRLWTRKLEGRGRVYGIKLRAGATQAFCRALARDYTGRIVPLHEAVDMAPEVRDEVLDTDDAEEALLRFVRRLSSARRPDADVSMAVALVERIVNDPTITSVDRLANVAGYGPRALQRIFVAHVGASPKWVIRLHRLQEVALRIERGDHPTLAALAAELGYCDQAHLARDFRRAVGRPPSALIG